jgi:predicted ATPase
MNQADSAEPPLRFRLWVYALDGLACPPPGVAGDPAGFDAAALFLQTARRADLGFQVSDEQAPHLVDICNLVAGLPLALELAAAWVRVMSLAEIAAEIGRHLDFLADAMRDRPERHRSLRAVLDHTWRLLSAEEGETFCKLSISPIARVGAQTSRSRESSKPKEGI